MESEGMKKLNRSSISQNVVEKPIKERQGYVFGLCWYQKLLDVGVKEKSLKYH